MPGQQTCAPPVIVTLPAQLDAAAAEQAADQITAAFTPGVSVVIADLTAAACCDRSAIRNLLKAHRKAAARGGRVRFAIRPGGPLHQITDFADTHPLLAVYPTLQHALTGRSPIPPGNRGFPAATISPAAPAITASRNFWKISWLLQGGVGQLEEDRASDEGVAEVTPELGKRR
jgi:hypothetical protein